VPSRIASHNDLILWKKSVELAGKVYAATRRLPSDERMALSLQLRRSALRVASNVAEGSARRSRAEFLQFLQSARGSLAELETQLLVATDQKLIPEGDDMLRLTAEVRRLLNALITGVRHAAQIAHARSCNHAGQPSPAGHSDC
jgi:four helix bundle protein